MSREDERLMELLGQAQKASRALIDLTEEIEHCRAMGLLMDREALPATVALTAAFSAADRANEMLLGATRSVPRTAANHHAWRMGLGLDVDRDEDGRPYCREHDIYGCEVAHRGVPPVIEVADILADAIRGQKR